MYRYARLSTPDTLHAKLGVFWKLVFVIYARNRLVFVRKGTRYAIFVLQLVIEKTIDTADKELYLTFID